MHAWAVAAALVGALVLAGCTGGPSACIPRPANLADVPLDAPSETGSDPLAFRVLAAPPPGWPAEGTAVLVAWAIVAPALENQTARQTIRAAHLGMPGDPAHIVIVWTVLRTGPDGSVVVRLLPGAVAAAEAQRPGFTLASGGPWGRGASLPQPAELRLYPKLLTWQANGTLDGPVEATLPGSAPRWHPHAFPWHEDAEWAEGQRARLTGLHANLTWTNRQASWASMAVGVGSNGLESWGTTRGSALEQGPQRATFVLDGNGVRSAQLSRLHAGPAVSSLLAIEPVTYTLQAEATFDDGPPMQLCYPGHLRLDGVFTVEEYEALRDAPGPDPVPRQRYVDGPGLAVAALALLAAAAVATSSRRS